MAQERCGFHSINGLDTEEGQKRMAAFEKVIQKKVSEIKSQDINHRTHGTVYKIPVVIHIIHNGESIGEGSNIRAEQAYSQIDVLNEDFRKLNADLSDTRSTFIGLAGDSEIEFVLATVDPDGNELPEPGIHRYYGGSATNLSSSYIENTIKPATSFDPYNYANFWVVNNISGGILGYAYLPDGDLDGLSGGVTDVLDGLVMGSRYFGSKDKYPDGNYGAPYDLGRTTTHEIGHWLGLHHIWGPGNGSCDEDDYVSDTPNQTSDYGGCPSSSETSCNSLDMWENFMDYTNDACMHMFTSGQVDRMRAVMEMDARRISLASSNTPVVTTPTEPFNAFLYDYELTNCGARFTSNAYIPFSTETPTVSWTFENGSITGSSDAEVEVDFPPGTHSVTFSMTSSLGTKSTTFDIAVAGGGFTTLPFSEEFASGLPSTWVQSNTTWITAFANSPYLQTIAIDNFNNDYHGFPRNIHSPAFSVNGLDALSISFDLAYTYFTDGSNSDYDSLALYLIDECQGLSLKIWQDGGESLATAAAISTSFTPTSSDDWESKSFFVAIPDGWENASLVFSSLGNGGNNLYVDNINIEEANLNLTVSIGDDQEFCDQSSFTLTSSITDADTYEWVKLGGNGEVLSTTSSLVATESGDYRLLVSKDGEQGLDAATLTFLITPVADFTYDADEDTRIVTFTNTTESYSPTTYAWDFDDGKSSTDENPLHFYVSIGDYVVTLTATNDCGTHAVMKAITEITALESSLISQQIQVFPNPNRGEFMLDLSQTGSFQQASLELIDITGRVVWSAQEDYFAQKNIKLTEQGKGIYFLKLNLDGNLAVKRILIE